MSRRPEYAADTQRLLSENSRCAFFYPFFITYLYIFIGGKLKLNGAASAMLSYPRFSARAIETSILDHVKIVLICIIPYTTVAPLRVQNLKKKLKFTFAIYKINTIPQKQNTGRIMRVNEQTAAVSEHN